MENNSSASAKYSRTQMGWVIIIALLAPVAVTAWVDRALVAGTPGRLLPWIIVALLTLLIPLFGWLTVTVDAETVTARFGIGLIRKKIRLAEIRNATRVRNKWSDGLGVRLLPGAWMFNVAGLDAVELELGNGGKFRIGTDRPEELIRAIRPS